MLGDVKRVIGLILGGIVGLIVVDTLKDGHYLTWNKVLGVTVIAIIGSFIGLKIRNLVKEAREDT